MPKSLRPGSEQQFNALLDRLFYCPSCTTWRLPSRNKSRSTPASLRTRRHASTLNSHTAINATKPVPPRLKPLYEALIEVRRTAQTHVNTSRLQLALQGLESANPTIRIAILGLNTPDTARRIARLLQADPLEDERAWERQLVAGQDDYSRGLFIRYGQQDNPNTPRPRNAIPVLYIPSAVLRDNNIEILISSVSGPENGATQAEPTTPSDTFLSPVIAVPTSFEGRQTIVSQPVHQSLLVVRGLDELLAASQLLASTHFNSREDRDSVRLAVELGNVNITTSHGVITTNIRSAEEGLAAIRQTVTKAMEYEHKWMASGIPALSNWLILASGSKSSMPDTLPKSIQNLVASVLNAAELSIKSSTLAADEINAERSLTITSRTAIEDAIETFSRSAHQELQSGLSSAWSSRNWRRLAWYKLFWRVDDVGLIVTDLVTNAWLPKTERAVYEMSGRLVQLGISPVIHQELQESLTAQLDPSLLQPDLRPAALEPTAQLATSPLALSKTEPVLATNPANQQPQIQIRPIPTPTPITATIPTTRTISIQNSITSLTTTAQQLVLRTLSITSLTAGLSALSYLSSLSASAYEAGTIFAVGTVFALWRMQGGWQKATAKLERDLFSEGRDVIGKVMRNMEGAVRRRVEDDRAGGMAELEVTRRAGAVVKRARDELEKVKSSA